MSKTPKPIDVEVGSRIRAQRVAKGMSQTDLGKALKLTFQQVQKYEKGTNRIGSSRLAQIADVLEVTPAFFFPSSGKGKSETPEVVGLVGTPGAAKLLQAYAEIRNRRARQVVVALAESLRDLKV